MKTGKIRRFRDIILNNPYPGRGIIVGESPDAGRAVIAYFIMGRSANSRNRVLAEEGGVVSTRPFDESLVEDPSLIIYNAVRSCGDHLIVSNGDQTDTICESLAAGGTFYEALETRTFEPDGPNWTPRISADIVPASPEDACCAAGRTSGHFHYSISILKSEDADGTICGRYGYDYEAVPGAGHFIHTYACDGNPLPSFEGEPVAVEVPGDIDEFANEIWNALDEDNKISLYIRFTDMEGGREESRLINKNGEK